MSLSLKVHWPMVAYGFAFGLAASLTGIYVLAAVEVHGFFAEGFFLLVIGWIIIFAGVAKAISKMKEMKKRDSGSEEE